MGSSGSGAADCSVGPIVWVRRRNGSWWPGKILGPDELTECNLTSPRTGTPVKLLGREDASVDWYNLEKSKRVKAFRCGEFDDCIERAESAQGMPIKKREKYARREDAILHALELEKQLLKKQGKLNAIIDQQQSKSSGPPKKEPVVISEGLANNCGKPGNGKLSQLSNRVDANVKDETVGNPMKVKDVNQPTSEDDHSEATPRMRGLQDFGLRTAPLKRKLPSSRDLGGSVIPLTDNHLKAYPAGAPSMEGANHANGLEQMGAICRAKRSRCIYFSTGSSDSLDDNNNQIKDDDVGHPSHGSLHEQNSPRFMDNVESDSSQKDSSDSDSVSESESESESDSSETEPDVPNERAVFPGAVIPIDAEQNAMRPPEAPGEHGSTSSDEPDELAFSGEISHLYPDDPFLANEAVSKWQLKGKRNIRHLTKKSVDRCVGKVLNGHGTYHGIKGGNLGQRAYGVDDTDLRRKYIETQMVGLDSGRYSHTPRFAYNGRNNSGHDGIDWRDMTWKGRPVFKEHWEERAEHFNPIIFGRNHFGGRTRTMLVDVDLKVQASYQKERVPIVSLMSKLNGKAIIGHPIQIEALEDGSSECLVSTSDYHGNETVDHDGNTSLSPAWRTARRTNFRVPRPNLSPMLGAEDVAEDLPFTDQEGRLPFKKSPVGSFNNKAGVVHKSLPHISRPSMDRKLSRKLPKKANLSSNQKTRTLSSISVQPNFGIKPIHCTSISRLDGLIKPETSRPTTVACIPVKLVFSRLLEKINRPPSKAACKVVTSNRDAERQPS